MFTADNMNDDDISKDMFGENANNFNASDEENKIVINSDNSEDEDENDLNIKGSKPKNIEPNTNSKGKRPLRFGGSENPPKKLKKSLADLFMTANIAKEERAAAVLNFEKQKWEEELEEKKMSRRTGEEERKRDYELSLKKVNTESMLAKVALIKSLKDIGLSQDEILEKIKGL